MSSKGIPPPTLTPRRFPAESEEPALKPPARFVAVRIPSGRVGLTKGFGIADGRESNEVINEGLCRIIIVRMASNRWWFPRAKIYYRTAPCRVSTWSQNLRVSPSICSHGNASKQTKIIAGDRDEDPHREE
jgi:hypothetical protein